MKKICLASLLLSVCLVSGCTKTYESVDEYISAMNDVKTKNPSYVIEADMTAKEPGKTTEYYYRSSVKGDKWKIDISTDRGNTYPSSMLYDGNEILVYSDDSPYAMVSPVTTIMKMDKDKQNSEFLMRTQNPALFLIDWEKEFNIFTKGITGEFVNNNDTRNGFKCRLIKFTDNREVCVSDKYGIAVYMNVLEEDSVAKNLPKGATVPQITENVVKIDTTELSDDLFKLPEGKKKMTFEDMMKEMQKEMQKSFGSLKNKM